MLLSPEEFCMSFATNKNTLFSCAFLSGRINNINLNSLLGYRININLNLLLGYLIFEAMSVVPQGALAARKVRQNNEKLKMEYERSDCIAELSPTKYSSKFMNSVWGMYNRYSVHNFKKNMDEGTGAAFGSQQKESAGPAHSVEKNSADFKGSLAVSSASFLASPGFL